MCPGDMLCVLFFSLTLSAQPASSECTGHYSDIRWGSDYMVGASTDDLERCPERLSRGILVPLPWWRWVLLIFSYSSICHLFSTVFNGVNMCEFLCGLWWCISILERLINHRWLCLNILYKKVCVKKNAFCFFQNGVRCKTLLQYVSKWSWKA